MLFQHRAGDTHQPALLGWLANIIFVERFVGRPQGRAQCCGNARRDIAVKGLTHGAGDKLAYGQGMSRLVYALDSHV